MYLQIAGRLLREGVLMNHTLALEHTFREDSSC